MPQFRARSLSRCGRSARCSYAKTSKAREREGLLEALGLSSGGLPEVEVIAIISFYVIFLRLTADVSAVTISQYAI
jgi:hypothetical protein